MAETTYAPPPGPPPNAYSPSFHSPLPTDIPLLNFDQLFTLGRTGYLSLPFSSSEFSRLHAAYNAVFALTQEYFALEDTHPHKADFKPSQTGAQASEDGWSRIPGEKQILTVRHTKHAPPGALRDAIADAWALSGPFLLDTLRALAHGLGLDAGVFDGMVEPCIILPGGMEVSPTLFRAFRYERPPTDGERKMVAEAHRDLGLLSLVVGHSPGLDVLEPPSPGYPRGRWLAIEEDHAPADGGPTATLLGGLMLSWLTNGCVRAGTHRVYVAPSSSIDDPHRFSLVFALRPADGVVLDQQLFQGAVTGRFAESTKFDGRTAGSIMREIQGKLFNINITQEERAAQKARLAELKRRKNMEAEDAEELSRNASSQRTVRDAGVQETVF